MSHVLVVEDSRTQAQEIQLVLESHGFEVTVVPSAEAALSKLEASDFDLMLSDIQMDGLSGIELCEIVKKDPRWTALPVVLLTNQRDPIDILRAVLAGADNFITKPFDEEYLIGRIRRILDQVAVVETAGPAQRSVSFQGQELAVPPSYPANLGILVSTFEEIARSNAELQARQAELKRVNEELSRAQLQKSELTSLVVHDLKNPIAVVQSYIELVTEEEVSDAARGFLSTTLETCQAMNRMVMNLLDIDRSEEGQLQAVLAPVDLTKLTRDVIDGMKSRVARVNRRLEPDVPATPVEITADGDLLRRVLENLVDNALKHAPRESAIRLKLSTSESFVDLSVIDSGPGVPDALKQRIFEKYVSLNEGSSRGFRTSRGLGLVFCQLASRVHGGEILVEDVSPQGACFRVHLPRRPAPAAPGRNLA